MANIWDALASEIIYQTPWFRIRKDTVVMPDGNPGIYSVMELKASAGVVALTDKNKVVLVGQYRYPIRLYSWEIPMGASAVFDSHEDPLITAQRELHEETGISARYWTKLGTVHTQSSSTNEVVHLFLARDLEMGESHPDTTEMISTTEIPLDQLVRVIRAASNVRAQGDSAAASGRITNATSIAAIYMAKDYLLEESSNHGYEEGKRTA